MTNEELVILYHGTELKKTVDKILREGFAEWSYFAKDLNVAITQGGKYIFEVVFLKNEIPDYWQVRCENEISPSRIIKVSKYEEIEIIKNKNLQSMVFDNLIKFSIRKAYCFEEKNALELKANY